MTQEKTTYTEASTDLTPEIEAENRVIHRMLCRISMRWQGLDPDAAVTSLPEVSSEIMSDNGSSDQTILIGATPPVKTPPPSPGPVSPEPEPGSADMDETVIISPTMGKYPNPKTATPHPTIVKWESEASDNEAYDKTVIISAPQPEPAAKMPAPETPADDQTIIIAPQADAPPSIDTDNGNTDADATIILGASPHTTGKKVPYQKQPPPLPANTSCGDDTVIIRPPSKEKTVKNIQQPTENVTGKPTEKKETPPDMNHATDGLHAELPEEPDDDIKLETVILGPEDYE